MGDRLAEPNETFSVNLSNPNHATIGSGSGRCSPSPFRFQLPTSNALFTKSRGIGTILNDD
jgi:hypothetical protein